MCCGSNMKKKHFYTATKRTCVHSGAKLFELVEKTIRKHELFLMSKSPWTFSSRRERNFDKTYLRT
eukprot:TRINITY_DN1279_c0_g1_i1.p3 TRINITY_DN1279_c0_g1~~TRINITY_DN1279_c0_g1_i1.p3  ORF type:complete len:66 (-),score=5.10 TRINITY_DN1279_c0_g1_i1:58-255(-)